MSSIPRDHHPGDGRAGPAAAAWRAHATASIVHATLEVLLDAAPSATDPLAAELLGAEAAGVWWSPAGESLVAIAEHERLVGRAYAAHLAELADAPALAALRSLQLGAGDGMVPEVRSAADRLAAGGVPDPGWWSAADDLEALRGAHVSWRDDGHDYTSLLLEVDRAGIVLTMAVATLDDCSGVVGDVLLFTDLDGFADVVRDPVDGRRLHWCAPAAIQRRIRHAIDRTDLLGVGDPPGSSRPEIGYVGLRSLAQRWSDAPSAGGPPPGSRETVDPAPAE